MHNGVAYSRYRAVGSTSGSCYSFLRTRYQTCGSSVIAAYLPDLLFISTLPTSYYPYFLLSFYYPCYTYYLLLLPTYILYPNQT